MNRTLSLIKGLFQGQLVLDNKDTIEAPGGHN